MSYSPHSLGCPFADPATVTIFYKMMLKDWIDIIKDEVVHYAVTKVRRKYFPFHWLVYDKADALPYLVSTIYNIFIKNK
jgi:hypothetical protein